MEGKNAQEVSNPRLPKFLTTVTAFSKTIAIILFITLPFLGFYLGMKYNQQLAKACVGSQIQNNVPAPIITPTSSGAGTENIKFIKLSDTCDDVPQGGIDITLKRAYLIPSFADFPKSKTDEINNANFELKPTGLLAVEGEARNITTDFGKDLYSTEFLRLRRGTEDYSPVTYGPTILPPQANGIVYAYFPISSGENSFTLMYCNFTDHPSLLNVNFNVENVETLTGSYSINKGFIQ